MSFLTGPCRILALVALGVLLTESNALAKERAAPGKCIDAYAGADLISSAQLNPPSRSYLELWKSGFLLSQTSGVVRELRVRDGGLCGPTCMSNALAIVDGDIHIARPELESCQAKRVEEILRFINVYHDRNSAYGTSPEERLYAWAKALQIRHLTLRGLLKILRPGIDINEADLEPTPDHFTQIGIRTVERGHVINLLGIDTHHKLALISDPLDPSPQVSRYEITDLHTSESEPASKTIRFIDLAKKYGDAEAGASVTSITKIRLTGPEMKSFLTAKSAKNRAVFDYLTSDKSAEYINDRSFRVVFKYANGTVRDRLYVVDYLVTDSPKTTSVLVKSLTPDGVVFETVQVDRLLEITASQ